MESLPPPPHTHTIPRIKWLSQAEFYSRLGYSRIRKGEITLYFPALPSGNLSSAEFVDRLPLRYWLN